MFATVVIDAVIGNDDKVFDYIVPEGLLGVVFIGCRVFVPFGPREVEGFVLGLKEFSDIEVDKLKSIAKVPDEFVALKEEALAIAPEICKLFKLRLIDVLRLFVPATIRGRKRVRKVENKELAALNIANKHIELTGEQQAAVDAVLSDKETFILHGVTGSGKTEVYMNIIGQVLQQGKSAILLVPEIGLTPQVLGNFRARFGNTVAMIHSALKPTEKYDQWVNLHTGESRIVIGARSAIFAPLENVGVIIIDEEHDTSYFSESNPRFSTHEVAKIRARYNSCSLVLGSATPSIETMHKANHENVDRPYKVLRLEKRVCGLPMPRIQIVDMAAEIRAGNGGIFSRDFLGALVQTIEAGQQAMIFLNRRGYQSFVMCNKCGWVAQCDECDVSLVWHKDDNMLKCHYCCNRFTQVTACKSCSSTHLAYGRLGTQKVVEELEATFPNVPIFRLDADNTREKSNLVQILNDFAKTSPSILVGTQMIAKGHDFPKVQTVGIIDADNSLHFSDYRATERTFSLITQVAGRAGRAASADALSAHVFLQTYKPRHYVYQLASNYDYDRFFEKELNTRQITKYPPYTTIVRILVTGEVDAPIKDLLQKFMIRMREKSSEFVYVGAMKSPLGRVQNKYRYQILARFLRHKEKDMIDFMHEIVKAEKCPRNTHVFIEINPQNLS